MLSMIAHGKDRHVVARGSLPTEIIRPERAGSRWRGVPHRDLAEGFVKEFERRGCEILRDEWALASKGRVMIGGLDLRLPDLPDVPGQNYALSVWHANDMSKSMRVSVGARLMICFNGVMTGDLILDRKHTSGVNLGMEIMNCADRALTEFNETHKVIEGMKTRRMGAPEIDHAFMEVGRQDILPWSAIGKAWENYQKPPFSEFQEFNGRAWGVYQAINEVIKQRAPLSQMAGLRRLTKLLKAS